MVGFPPRSTTDTLSKNLTTRLYILATNQKGIREREVFQSRKALLGRLQKTRLASVPSPTLFEMHFSKKAPLKSKGIFLVLPAQYAIPILPPKFLK
jgi:hypothetical protein